MRYIVLVCFLALQVFYCIDTAKILPKLGIVPALPSKQEMAALSFGDNQLYFRGLALNLQMSGDTFGRSTPLKDYNYPKLLQWFRLLDTLDAKSHYMPSVAAYYFSRSQNISDVKYVLDYLEEHSFKDPEHNWWWLGQSIYLANSVLKDKPRAIRIANKLRHVKAEMPIWTRQMEAFIYEDLGDKKEAEAIMCESFEFLRNSKDVPERELDFMIHFFKERMGIKDTDSERDVEQKIQHIAQTCYQISKK